jgi:hypothetical protein
MFYNGKITYRHGCYMISYNKIWVKYIIKFAYTNYTVYRLYEDSWWVYVCVGEGVSYILLKLYNIFHSIFIISFTKTTCIYIYFTQIVLYILLKLDYIFYSNLIILKFIIKFE